MDTFFSKAESEGAEEPPHSIHRSQRTRSLNPLAPLELPDGRIYRLEEVRIIASTQLTIRWKVEIEAQMNGRSDNVYFRVQITYDAIKRGELEAQGYDTTCDRNTAILMLARKAVRAYLLQNRYPPRYSAHYRPVMLEV